MQDMGATTMREGHLPKARREDLGRMLSWLRVQRGMTTRTALRDVSGVSLTTIKNLEEGRTARPRDEILLQLDGALGLPPQTLVSYARGTITADTVRRAVGAQDLPVWIRVPKNSGNDQDPLRTLVEVLGTATTEQQRRVVEAAMRILSEDDTDA